MRSAWRSVACGVPGLGVAAAALLAGVSPAVRDLPAYFLPLRHHVAEALHGRTSALWSSLPGCGEPVLANPQFGVFYPPAWLAAVLPPQRAIGVEIGVHLALLGLGTGLLARRLGAREGAEVGAAWGVVLAGPMVDAAGVLNNLDTLAWVPWLWGAALGGRGALVAAFAALAWLGAEPWLAGVAAVVAMAMAPTRRTLGALLLAGGLVAAQALPFAGWVEGGDRGKGISPEAAAKGAVTVREVAAMVVPGLPLPPRGDRFVAHLAVPFWALLLGAFAVLGRGPSRRLALLGWVALGAAVLPGLPLAREAWAWLTRGLVWYPGRLVFIAVVALVPAAATLVGTAGHRFRAALGACVLGLGGGLLAGGSGLELAVQTVCAVATLGGPVPTVAAALGSASLGPTHLMALDLSDLALPPLDPCLTTPAGQPGRWFAFPVSREQLVWVEHDPLTRQRALGWGYWGLRDGRPMARTFGPIQSRHLAAHLAHADQGPPGRWWLDSLAARWLVGQGELPRFPRRCRSPAGTVLVNPTAWPETWVVTAVPTAEERPTVCGSVEEEVVGGHRARWRCHVDAPQAVLLLSRTPDPGWRFWVDGRPVPVTQGPGILHGVAVPAGEHVVEARYRPRGLVVGLGVSLLGALAWVGVAWRRW
ncbi:MAG: YfhO family protein [Thermoanaerobaculaceae bacterium]|nr:YfhO family protein [Thermoanaerobaculaceae bacterium]MDI9620673.1 YfhO family protein [Acidobacteriota bacterium]NLH10282.1 YfhO family protein [Holophagae bacterium]